MSIQQFRIEGSRIDMPKGQMQADCGSDLDKDQSPEAGFCSVFFVFLNERRIAISLVERFSIH